MATTVARLEAILSASTRDFDRDIDRSDRKMHGIGKTAGTAGKAIAAGFAVGAGAVAIGAKKSIDAASNLNESINAVNVVFGDAGKQIHEFSSKAAREAGLSMRELNEKVTPIGAQLQNTGLSADQAAKASINLTKRAADMASVFNTDVGEALGAIQAGLRGEADPLERFGVGLSAASVQAKAMEMGLAKVASELTTQDKMQARLALLMEQTNRVQGDFVNTSDSMANRQRILRAKFENLQAKIGQKLLPVMTTLMGAALKFTDWVSEKAAPFISNLVGRLTGDGGGGGASLKSAFQGVTTFVTETLFPTFKRLWEWMDANLLPVFKTLGGIVKDAFNAIGGVLKDNEPELRRMLDLAKDIGEMLLWLVNKVILPVLKPVLTKVLPVALGLTIDALDLVVKSVQKIIDAFKWIGDNAERIWGKVSGILGKIPGVGDAANPFFVPPTGWMEPAHGAVDLRGALEVMRPFAQAAAGYGLAVTSGLRPGAITANGTLSDHAVGKALDVSGSAAGMAGFFRSLIGNPLVKQAFYDPLGSIFGGLQNMYREGGHSDHVHVATYDRGGFLRPGWNLAYNGTGALEPVGAGATINLYNHGVLGSEREVVGWLKNAFERDRRRG